MDALIIMGGAQITTQALDACVSRRIRVASLRASGAVRFVVNGATGGNVHLRLFQYKASMNEDHSPDVSRLIVAAKLQNSAKIVDRWARDANDPSTASELAERVHWIRGRVDKLREAQTGDHVRGIEGDAARIYFRAIGKVVTSGEFVFTSRNRRPPRDPINAMMGYLYSLLVTEFIGAVESVGLDHQVGFLHRPRSGRPSLALDLAEELRAFTDRFVVTLVRRRQISLGDFTEMPGGGVYLNDDGRAKLIREWEEHKESEMHHSLLGKSVGRWAVPSIQATLLARHLRGDLPSYPPFVLHQ